MISATKIFWGKFGRMTASFCGSLLYWFRNYVGTGGFFGGGSLIKELFGCTYWNLV